MLGIEDTKYFYPLFQAKLGKKPTLFREGVPKMRNKRFIPLLVFVLFGIALLLIPTHAAAKQQPNELKNIQQLDTTPTPTTEIQPKMASLSNPENPAGLIMATIVTMILMFLAHRLDKNNKPTNVSYKRYLVK